MKMTDEQFESLVRMLENAPSILSRSLAAGELGDFGDPRAIEPLRKCLDETDPEIIGSAIQALGKLKDKVSIPRFLSFLDKSQNNRVRMEAISALSALKYLPAQPYFQEMLHDTDDIVRYEAMRGLLNLSDFKGPEIKANLLAFLSDSYEPNRHLAQQSLKLIEMDEEGEG